MDRVAAKIDPRIARAASNERYLERAATFTRHSSLVRSAARRSECGHAPTPFRLREAGAVLDRAANLLLGNVAFAGFDLDLYPALLIRRRFVRDLPVGNQDDFVGKRL